MPEFNVKDYLANDALTFRDVVSTKHPRGASYTVPAPSSDEELRMRRIVQLREAQTDGDGEATVGALTEMAALLVDDKGESVSFQEKMLGTAHAEMVEDGVTPTHIDMLASLVMTNYGVGNAMAGMVVEHASGEALARANRATRRRVAKSMPRKQRVSKPKAGPKLSPASSASDTPATPTATSSSARKTSARKQPARKSA